MKFISFILFIQFLFAGELKLSSIKIADGFSKPVYICQPPGDNERLFVLEQKGVVKMIKNGKKVRKPFADIRDRVHNPVIPGDERGLLGDRKSTRLNSSHALISYAVFCLKKKNKKKHNNKKTKNNKNTKIH